MGCGQSKNQVVDSSIALTQSKNRKAEEKDLGKSLETETANKDKRLEHDEKRKKEESETIKTDEKLETPRQEEQAKDDKNNVDKQISPRPLNYSLINVKPVIEEEDWCKQYLANVAIVQEWKALIQKLMDNKKLFEFALSKPRSMFNSLNQLGNFFKEAKQQEIAKNNLEVAWCIYVWITHNIAYNAESYFDKSIEDDQSPAGVLKTGKTMCGGYASLFQFLCDYVGIECLNINGYSKAFGYKHGDSFENKDTDHAWNAIKIDKKWHYVESTWGAGSIGANNTFSQKFTEHHFMTPAHIFHEKHYANEFKNVLGDTAPAHSLQDFEKMPMFSLNYHLNSMYCLTTEGQQTITTNKSIFIMEFGSTEKLAFSFTVKESDLKTSNDVQIFTQYDCKTSAKFNRYAFIIFFPRNQKIKQTKYKLEVYGRPINSSGLNDHFGDFYITYNAENQGIEKELETLRVPSYQLSFESFPEIELLSHKSSLIVFKEGELTKLVFKSSIELSISLSEFNEAKNETNQIDRSAIIHDHFNDDTQIVCLFLSKPYTRYKVQMSAQKSGKSISADFNLIRKGSLIESFYDYFSKYPKHDQQLVFPGFPEIELLSHKSSFIVFPENQVTRLVFKSPVKLSITLSDSAETNQKTILPAYVHDHFDDGIQMIHCFLPTPYIRYNSIISAKNDQNSFSAYFKLIREGNVIEEYGHYFTQPLISSSFEQPQGRLVFDGFPQLQLVSHNSSLIIFEEDEETKLVFKSPAHLSLNVSKPGVGKTSNELEIIQDQVGEDTQVVYLFLPSSLVQYSINLFMKKNKNDSNRSFVKQIKLVRKGTAIQNFGLYFTKQPTNSIRSDSNMPALKFEKFPHFELLSHNSSLIVFEEDQETKLTFKSDGALSTRVFELIGSEENEIKQSALIQNQFDVGLQLVYFSLPKPYTRYKVNLFAKSSNDSPLKFVTYLNLIRKGKATIERTFPVSYGYNYCRYYVRQPVYSDLKVGQMYEFEIVVEKPVKKVVLVVKSSNSWFHCWQDDQDKRIWRINKSFYQPDTLSINLSKDAESDTVLSIYQYKIVS